MQYGDGNRVVVANATEVENVLPPTLENVRSALGIGSDQSFAVPLTITSVKMNGGFNVVGRLGITGEPSKYPLLLNGSSNAVERIQMGAGDSLCLMLVHYGLDYYACVTSKI